MMKLGEASRYNVNDRCLRELQCAVSTLTGRES